MNIIAECLDCKHQTPYTLTENFCPKCGSGWREARYDFAAIGKILPEIIKTRPFDLWRHHELLPIESPNPSISMGEGGTPLLPAPNLGMMLGMENLFIKDERQNPTGSFKDRQAAVTITSLKEQGITEAVLASTGNVAISYSAYAARAGIKLWAFITSLVPAEKMREVAIYGTQVIKVTASYDQAKKVAVEFAQQRKHIPYLERGVQSISTLESMKTIAFEICEQLTDQLGPNENGKWRVPDWYIQSVSGGLGPVGVLKGHHELIEMGLTDRYPSVAAIQPEGCAPMVHAWHLGLDVAEPVVSPRTHIATLATGDPGRTYTVLKDKIENGNGGTFESVTDEDAFRAMHVLAKMEGLSMEPASSVAFAGLFKLVRSGLIKPDDVVVVNLTGHTMPIEKMILGEGWARNVVIPSKSLEEKPEEGLLSALNRVTPDRYPCVEIVDDHPDARRLIRRILQSQGEYKIFEASNGQDALKIAQEQSPDLMILDLMMPEVDGFSVLDQLKGNPQTEDIAVIVVTAKELTTDERKLLEGRIHALMQKGQFMNDDLLDEIKPLVN